MGLPSSVTPPARPANEQANHGYLPHITNPPPYQPRAQDQSDVELHELRLHIESQPAGTDEMLARKEKKKIRRVRLMIFYFFIAMILLVSVFIMVATAIVKKGMVSTTENPPVLGNTTSTMISPVASTAITTQTVTVTGLLPAIGPITMTTSTSFSTATAAITKASSSSSFQTRAVAPTHISVPTLAIASAASLSIENIWPTACPECN